MELKHRKIIAREILIIVSIIFVYSLVYVCTLFFDNHIKNVTQETLIEKQHVEKSIEIKKEQILTLRPPIFLPDAIRLMKPWEKYQENNKPKFDPSKSYIIVYCTSKTDCLKSNPNLKEKLKKDSIQSLVIKQEIFDLKKKKQVLTTELQKKYDTSSIVKNTLKLLLIIFYPFRIIFLGTVWSIRTLKKKSV